MDLMQVRGFHRIDSESRMPSASEHLKYIRWNNTLGVFEYTEHPGDTYITNITDDGTNVTIEIYKDGDTITINIPGDPFSLSLPGDTKVLFDKANTIGGSSKLTYDYNLEGLLLTDSTGVLAKNTTYDVISQNIIQYLGQNSLYLNYGANKAPSNMKDNNAIGRGALASVLTGRNNVAIGVQAGKDGTAAASNNVFIGAFAGRLEQGSDKLYIHNKDFNSLGEFQTASLLYGDFSLGRLWVNDRLAVREEIKVGDFDTDNNPEGGMVRMTPAADPALLKPQYYDNTKWVDFANNTDTYLEDITIDGDEYTFVMNGRPDITITIPDVSYPSSGSAYRVQLSAGDNTFIHDDKLSWSAEDILEVDGGILVKPGDIGRFPTYNGLIVNTGDHVYAYLNGSYRQLDNEPTSGEANHGENIGTAVEVYAGMNIANHNLQFYNLKGSDRIIVHVANGNNDIEFELNYTVSAANLGSTGLGLHTTTIHTDTTSILNFKRLHSSDNSVTLTDMGNYIDVTTAGLAGSGESNTGANVGDGTGLSYYDKNGLQLRFRSVKQGNNIVVTTDGQVINLAVDNLMNSITNIGTGIGVYKDSNTHAGKINANLKRVQGVNGIITRNSQDGDTIEFELDPALLIPNLDTNELPVATNSNKTLTWEIDYDADVRNSDPVTKSIVQLNLGSNIIYNSQTNTIDAIGGQGDSLISVANSLIIRKPDGTVNKDLSNKDVIFMLSNYNYITWGDTPTENSGLGWLAFENEFPVATDDKRGILQVDTSTGLTIVNGTLGYTPPDIPTDVDAVLFYPDGYKLHDWHANNQGDELNPPANSPVEPINLRRTRARNAIGAAYVNGRGNEVFQAKRLVVGASDGDFDSNGVHQGATKALFMHDNKITTDWGSLEIYKPRDGMAENPSNATKVVLHNGAMDLTIDPRDIVGGIGVYNFFMYNNTGNKIKVASLKGRYEDGELVADLRVKGNIKFHCTDAEML